MNIGNVLVTVTSGWLMDRAGRKPLLLVSTLCMMGAIGILTLALTHPGYDWTAPLAIVGARDPAAAGPPARSCNPQLVLFFWRASPAARRLLRG